MNIILRGEAQRQRAMQILETLPIDPAKPLAIKIEPHEEERSQAQSARYRATIGEAAKEIGYSPAELHDLLLARHFGTVETRMGDTVIVKPRRRTTTDENGKRSVMTKKKWRDYEDWAFAFVATEFGIEV